MKIIHLENYNLVVGFYVLYALDTKSIDKEYPIAEFYYSAMPWDKALLKIRYTSIVNIINKIFGKYHFAYYSDFIKYYLQNTHLFLTEHEKNPRL